MTNRVEDGSSVMDKITKKIIKSKTNTKKKFSLPEAVHFKKIDKI
jgi:hypothetical protein